jgi:uncharacterized damage-inducible protein DinB
MTESQRIADQLRRAFEGEAWHGPAVREILDGITAAQAIRRPLAKAHCIWEIVLHITQWEDFVLRRLKGELAKDLPPELDWLPVKDSSEAAWRATFGNLAAGNLNLRNAIAELSDERLQATVQGQTYSFYGLLHGVVQHDLYHAGQMAMLKKEL